MKLLKLPRNLGTIVGRVFVTTLMLCACVVPVLFVASPITYVPLMTIVLTVGLSRAYLSLIVRSLTYSEDSLLNSCERGQEIEFVTHFSNKCLLPVVRLEPHFYISDLFGEVATSLSASMVMMPREKRDFRFAASFDHIGRYSAGVDKIVIYDLLGLFQHTIDNPNRHEVSVLPRIFDITRIDLDNVSVQESRKAFRPIVTDDMDYAGVREYSWGDPLKTIHWKLSARNTSGAYYTRLFETTGNPGIDIIIDGTAPAYDSESLMQVFDGVVESALSVSIHAHQVGIDAALMYVNAGGETCRAHVLNVESSMPLIDAIPRIKVGEGEEARRILRREGNSIHAQGNIAYCTAHVNEELVTQLLDLMQHKRNPILFVVVPTCMEKKERQEYLRPLRRLEAANVTYYVVNTAAQIDAMGGGR